MPFLGAHESVSKGLHFAFDRIDHVGGDALQIFTRNQRQWNPKPLSDEEISQFQSAWEQRETMEVTSHASYLVNLASSKPDLKQKSVAAFTEELRRCHLLQLPYVVLHPGSHTGDGVEAGLERFVQALDLAIEAAQADTMVLVETTAGQGTGLGSTFEELGYIRESSRFPEKIGVCLDTCHIFAAGYDIRTRSGYDKALSSFDEHIGLEHLRFFHLNDSKKDLGSRVDRHEHIGAGCIGVEGFRYFLNDPRFAAHSMTLETPKGEDLSEDIENLATLRGLLQTR
jgi:deoxyribonuclease-4